MLLEIVTPDKAVFKGEVKLVRFPGSMGSFATLKNHAPIISTLQKGTLKTIDMEAEEGFFDSGGCLHLSRLFLSHCGGSIGRF